MNMPPIGIATALILIILGVAGYIGGDMVSKTALIPAFFGLPLLIASLISRNPDRLKLGMHIAATLGLLGFIAPLGRIIPQAAKGAFELNLASTCMILMSLVCGIFVVLCIKSFRDVRKAREANAA